MATTAKVIIKAEDQMKAGLKSVEKNLTGLEKTAKKVSDSLKGFLTVGVITAAVKAATGAVTACISSFRDTETALTRVDAVLRATGNQIGLTTKDLHNFAKSLQDVTTYSDETILGVEQLFITTQKVSKEILPQATEAALDMATALGQDATSAAERLAQALANPAEEIESLKEAQIFLDDEQQENIKTLVSQNKVYDAQQIILKEIEETYGGISRAIADTDTGKLDQIANTFDNVKSGLGNLFVDTLGPVLDWINENLSEIERWIDSMNEQRSIRSAIESNSSLASFSDDALIKALKPAQTGSGGYTYNTDSKTIERIIQELTSRGSNYPGNDSNLSPLMKEVRAWAQEGLEQNKLYQFLIANLDSPLSQEDLIKNNLGVYFDERDKMDYYYYQEILEGIENIRSRGYEETPSTSSSSLSLKPYEPSSSSSSLDITEAVSRGVKALAPILNPIDDELSNLKSDFSDTLVEIEKLSRDDFMESDLDAIFEVYKTSLKEMTSELSSLLYDPELEGVQKSLVQKSLNEATSFYTQVTKNLKELNGKQDDLQSSLYGIFSNIAQSGGAVGIVGAVLGEALGPILDAISPLLEIIDSVANPLTVLCTILEAIVDVMAPALQTVVQPLIDHFTLLGNLIGSWFLPIFDSLSVTMSAIGTILNTLLLPTLQILTPFMELFALLLDTLNPIIQAVAVVFEVLMSPVKFVADLFTWLGSWISYFGNIIGKTVQNLGYMISFQWGKVNWNFGSSPGGFSSDAFTGLPDRIAAIMSLGVTRGDAASDAASTGTSVSSAKYQGATSVTINIYQQSPVVGTGGMEEFAQMIRKEFEALDYYGVTV